MQPHVHGPGCSHEHEEHEHSHEHTHEHSHDHHEHSHGHSHDKRIQEFMEALHSGNAKQTLKQIKKVLKKGLPNPIDNLMMRMTEAMALFKVGEPAESEKCLGEISVDLLKIPHADDHVITMFIYAAKSEGLDKLAMETIEKLYKANPKDIEIAEKFFAECVAANNFQKLNIVSKDLENLTHSPQYTLCSVYSLYMYAKYTAEKNSSTQKGYTKLAGMEFAKYMAQYKVNSEQLPKSLFDLHKEILLLSDVHPDIIKIVDSQKNLEPLQKSEYICNELKELKQYPECINEYLKMFTTNIQKGQKAEYIFENYQKLCVLLSGLYFGSIKTPSDILKNGLSEIWENREKLQIPTDLNSLKLNAGEPLETIKKIFEIFCVIAHNGKLNETLLMGLNEIRGAYLILIFLLHKFLLFAIKSDIADTKSFTDLISKIIISYSTKFVSTTSVYSDILPYCAALSPEHRSELIKAVKNSSDNLNKPDADYVKFLASRILYYKLQIALIPLEHANIINLLKEISGLYKEARSKLTKKLEKGERHQADDLILLIDYLLSKIESTPNTINPLIIQRIAILSQAAKDSPSNFDFNLQLLKLLMSVDFHYFTREIYENLRVKGVLTETLGFLYEKYLIENMHSEKLMEVMKKYEKFELKSRAELAESKVKAINDCNFYQAEDLYKYEQYHSNSHHRIVLGTAVTVSEYLTHGQTKAQSIILGSIPKVAEFIGLLQNPEKLRKNQDVYTTKSKIHYIPHISTHSAQIKEKYDILNLSKSFEELVLDPVLAEFMQIGKTNYRENIMNVYGVLEITQLNALLHVLCNITGYYYEKNYTKLRSDVELFEKTVTEFIKNATILKTTKIYEKYAHEIEDLIMIFEYANQMLKLTVGLNDLKEKDPTQTYENLIKILLEQAKGSSLKIIGQLKALFLAKPIKGTKKWDGLTEIHSLFDNEIRIRGTELLKYFGTVNCMIFTMIKLGFPEELAKKAKKGEQEKPGETIKKAFIQLKKDIQNSYNEVLNSCQNAKLNEELAKFIGNWEPIDKEILEIPLISEINNSENTKELHKKVKDEILMGINHIQTAFSPIPKTLASIDL